MFLIHSQTFWYHFKFLSGVVSASIPHSTSTSEANATLSKALYASDTSIIARFSSARDSKPVTVLYASYSAAVTIPSVPANI